MRCPARSSACLSDSWLQANRALLQAIGAVARFSSFSRLSAVLSPSRRAALRMPRLTTRSTFRSSQSSQPPTPNNDKPPSSTEPSPSPSSSQPLHLSGSPRRSAASNASWLRRDQQHQKPSPPPRCYRRTFASSNVRARQAQHPRRSSPNPHG